MQQIDIGRVYNEHCLTTLARMPDEFLDMTLTSPPYDDLRDYNGYHVLSARSQSGFSSAFYCWLYLRKVAPVISNSYWFTCQQ